VGFKFELKTVDGDDAGSFETAVPNWQTGDTLIAAGNVHYRVAAVLLAGVPGEFARAGFVSLREAAPQDSRCVEVSGCCRGRGVSALWSVDPAAGAVGSGHDDRHPGRYSGPEHARCNRATSTHAAERYGRRVSREW
jgi:hypothetical protein